MKLLLSIVDGSDSNICSGEEEKQRGLMNGWVGSHSPPTHTYICVCVIRGEGRGVLNAVIHTYFLEREKPLTILGQTIDTLVQSRMKKSSRVFLVFRPQSLNANHI